MSEDDVLAYHNPRIGFSPDMDVINEETHEDAMSFLSKMIKTVEDNKVSERIRELSKTLKKRKNSFRDLVSHIHDTSSRLQERLNY